MCCNWHQRSRKRSSHLSRWRYELRGELKQSCRYGYGVYCDNASNNTISSNIATGEQGGGTALGDGIYMYYSNANTITHTNLSANHVFGISLYHSSGNTISNNSILNNQDIGVRLRESNNNTLTFNTVSGNVNLGILSITEL